MPVERVSKGFKDIGSAFQVNPLSNDLIAIKNETAISRSIRNLIFTLPGERFFNQDLGSNISRSLFENIDNISASLIEDQIRNTIDNFEPRVELNDVIVKPNFENNEFNVTIIYNIIGAEVLSQQLSFALQQTR
tara:strand:+ start:465 stop:866 length:402 start_codon:yes stop_codon:yes gene_type:complete